MVQSHAEDLGNARHSMETRQAARKPIPQRMGVFLAAEAEIPLPPVRVCLAGGSHLPSDGLEQRLGVVPVSPDHDPRNASRIRDLFEGIPVNHDQVCILALLDRAESFVNTESASRVDRADPESSRIREAG